MSPKREHRAASVTLKAVASVRDRWRVLLSERSRVVGSTVPGADGCQPGETFVGAVAE